MERSRPIRNRRHSRKVWPGDILHRPVKRLFTPEIKRMLKEWLIRRRDNPYPSRDEKKTLAQETGLTYTQICNWFANWRRKLKNSGRERLRKNWGNLIKNYNTSAKGNVEQFSICSSDSIWGEENINLPEEENIFETSEQSHIEKFEIPIKPMKRKNKKAKNIKTRDKKKQSAYKSSFASTLFGGYAFAAFTQQQQKEYQLSAFEQELSRSADNMYLPTSKFKNHIMEKYLRGLDTGSNANFLATSPIDTNNNSYKTRQSEEASTYTGPELSKWLESAAKFTPSRENYIEWCAARETSKDSDVNLTHSAIHQKEEIEAAEALTKLALNFRNRFGA